MLTAPGDGVIINPPVYPPYFADIPHAGRRIVEVPLLRGLRAGLRRASTRRSRPARARCCSATRTTRRGRVLPREELTAMRGVADAHGAWVIADEIHGPLTFPATSSCRG